MSRFVDKTLIPVFLQESSEDRVYILPRMNKGMERRVQQATAHTRVKDGQGGQETDVQIDMPAYNNALLCEFIVRWEGPGFEGRAFSPQALDDIDKDDPLIDLVLTRINELNTAQRGAVPDPNSSSGDGSPPLTDAGEGQ